MDANEPTELRTVARERKILSPWVTLETVSVGRAASTTSVEMFHAFRQADYVHVLAMTEECLFVLVRQYRPVIDQWTLEFPGGLREMGEDPAVTAGRELREETGLEPIELVPLVECMADVGRLCNKFFGFFAVARRTGVEAERNISTVLLSGPELREYATAGRIASSSHVGLLFLAAVHPRVRELCQKAGHRAVPWLI